MYKLIEHKFLKIFSPDKKLKILIENFHEPYHDIQKDKLKQLITEWIKKKIESKKVKKFGNLFKNNF